MDHRPGVPSKEVREVFRPLCISAGCLDSWGDSSGGVAVIDAVTLEYVGASDGPVQRNRISFDGKEYNLIKPKGPTGSAWLMLSPE